MKITDYEEGHYEITLPQPLDKPMKKIYPIYISDEDGTVYGEKTTKKQLIDAINELIDCQNTILELLKKVILK